MTFNKKKFQLNLLGWFSKSKRDLPWRKNKNPYRIWVSEIMLQQTQVITVIPYYKTWLKQFPTIQALAKAPISKVLRAWEGLGYYSRARNLKKGAKYIAKDLKGRFPKTREELLRIPGVGPYTAGAIASIAYGQKEPLVDGNVGRVFARLFELPGIWNEPEANKKLWRKAKELLPNKRVGDFNEALMELGATVCTKDNPDCEACPVKKYCRAFNKNTIHKYPAMKKGKTTKVEKVTLLLKSNGKMMVRRKKQGTVMGGLYEFPTLVLGNSGARGQGLGAGVNAVRGILKKEGIRVTDLRPLGKISHGYTRYRAMLDVWEGNYKKGSFSDLNFEKPIWVDDQKLQKIAFPSVFRKIERKFEVITCK